MRSFIEAKSACISASEDSKPLDPLRSVMSQWCLRDTTSGHLRRKQSADECNQIVWPSLRLAWNSKPIIFPPLPVNGLPPSGQRDDVELVRNVRDRRSFFSRVVTGIRAIGD